MFGGSWGATLGLTYAIHHPDKVKALMLRGICMGRRSEIAWLYQDGTSHIFPDKFQPFKDHVPEEERGDLIKAYYKRLTSSDQGVRCAAAREYQLWELSTIKLIPDQVYISQVIIDFFIIR